MPNQPEVVTITVTRRTLEEAITCLERHNDYEIALKELKAALDAAEMPNFFDKWGTL